jgi:tRNA G18 (ribose-2'-O)-methylase SpoU
VLDRARIVWRIDHSESVESLNAAVAGAIAMREVYGSVTGA